MVCRTLMFRWSFGPLITIYMAGMTTRHPVMPAAQAPIVGGVTGCVVRSLLNKAMPAQCLP